MLATEVRI